MRGIIGAAVVTLGLAACGGDAADETGRESPPAETEAVPAAAPETDHDRLETSPRHHEWQDVAQGERTVRTFVAYPERSTTGPAVVLIHENRGLNEWTRATADRLAEHGYLTLAPDLLSGTGPGGGGTEAFADSDAARTGIYALPPEQVSADLAAVIDHARTIPACNGTVAVVGFCWGGTQTFRVATSGADIAAACVFYGTAPDDPAVFANVRCPVHGFYGGDDARVNATLVPTQTYMTDAGKTFKPVVYDGAGHAFLRRGGQPDARPEDAAAHDAAWERLLFVLDGL